ncbi:MAG: helicase-associated domain-containing protein, partial [Actinomycetes bacterium]
MGLLGARPDVRTEPVPRGFEQLAQRLCLPNSLAAALRLLSLDLHAVGRVIAILGSDATVDNVAELMNAPTPAVVEIVDGLCRRGLAWSDDVTLRLPEPLSQHWTNEVGGGRPVAQIAKTVLVDELRITGEALGIEVVGLRKPELIEKISHAMSDRGAMIAAIKVLPAPARQRLDVLRRPLSGFYPGSFGHRGGADPTEALIRAGLVPRHHHTPEVPREVAVAAWLADHVIELHARPDIPPAQADPRTSLDAAHSAAQELLRTMTTVLDHAAARPLTALKKGGIGARERARLASRLSGPDDLLVLCLDLAYAAGLLAQAEAGYAPTRAYPAWRAAEPGHRWATLAHAWLRLEFAPTYRVIDEDKEQPPPLPLASAAGLIRRAMLTAAGVDASIRATGQQIDWFAPTHGYPKQERENRGLAAIREAELLGVTGADRVSELGEHLLAVTSPEHESTAQDPVAELAKRCAPLLPEAACTVILQSD